MSNSITFDANSHSVDAVTVFRTDRAEVVRKIKVDLKDGQNEIRVINLPSCIKEDSIRVEGMGKAVIFDVIYQPPPWLPSTSNDALRELNETRSQLIAELDILNQQAAVLKDYSKTVTANDTTGEKLEAFLDTYFARQHKINEARRRVEADRRRIDIEIESTRKSLNADEASLRERGVVITVVVLGEGDGEAEISLTYIVSGAIWTPQYDLRALIPMDDKSDSSVVLDYRASIRQSTGEDWLNVALKLSTASPLQGTTIPSLTPSWIGEDKPLTGRVVAPTDFVKGERREVVEEESDDDMGFGIFDDGPPPAPAPMRARITAAQDGAVSSTFMILGLSTIPSHTSSNSQTHKVSIAQIRLSDVELEWIAIPKAMSDAFLRCHVRNTSDFVLLPGDANVFMNNNFVAKSTVPHVSPKETFSCSLGVDPAIRITYHPPIKTKKTFGSIFSAKSELTTVEHRLSIKNTRLTRVSRLIIRDQVPVSKDARIKVNVLNPVLPNKSGAQETPIKDGVVSRWAQRDGHINDATSGDLGPGMLEWICQMSPGSNVDLGLSWEVSAPVGVTLG